MGDVVRIEDRIYGVERCRTLSLDPHSFRFTPLALCGTCEGLTRIVKEGFLNKTYPCPDCNGEGAKRCGECKDGLPCNKCGVVQPWPSTGFRNFCNHREEGGMSCPSPGCWHGWERGRMAFVSEGSTTKAAPPITMTDREAREVGEAGILRERVRADGIVLRDLTPVPPERALIAAYILSGSGE